MVDLTLAGNKLTGELPTQLGDLKKLSVLDVHDNLLSGMIPNEIGKIHQLKVLNICKYFSCSCLCHIKFICTSSFIISDSMLYLCVAIDNNRFEKTIPTTIGKLAQLTELVLGKYMIADVTVTRYVFMRTATAS